jgi:hypothetical protein
VAKRFWEAFSGMGLRGVSSDCESVKRTLMDRELGGTVLELCWIGRCWNRRRAVLELEVGGVGTG